MTTTPFSITFPVTITEQQLRDMVESSGRFEIKPRLFKKLIQTSAFQKQLENDLIMGWDEYMDEIYNGEGDDFVLDLFEGCIIDLD